MNNQITGVNKSGFVWSRDETQHETLLHEIPLPTGISNIGFLWGFNDSDVFQIRSQSDIFR